MKALIIEDEKPAADRLRKLIHASDESIRIVDRLDSVEDAVAYFNTQEEPDVVFMDIQLADGLSFEIFRRTELRAPVIFTTAFDQYALKAFEVNSIDYLLKPIASEDLERALNKLRKRSKEDKIPDYSALMEPLQQQHSQTYKKRFLLKNGSRLLYVNQEDVAYFISEASTSFLCDRNGKRFIVESTLDELESSLDPQFFFRVNRGSIVHINSVQQAEPYLNGRLLLHLKPDPGADMTVSRQRVKDFKIWMDK